MYRFQPNEAPSLSYDHQKEEDTDAHSSSSPHQPFSYWFRRRRPESSGIASKNDANPTFTTLNSTRCVGTHYFYEQGHIL
mmetsp:Transcript_24107/g.66822  ORF Transcript_24107/g.66822 Transcript_24107/m.66822 type:complete len:80 (+) Transcript_24107:906-1145(+)